MMKKKMMRGALLTIQGLIEEVLKHDEPEVVTFAHAETPAALAEEAPWKPPMISIPEGVFQDIAQFLRVMAEDNLYLNELRYPPDMCERWDAALREHADATANANAAMSLYNHCKEKGWVW